MDTLVYNSINTNKQFGKLFFVSVPIGNLSDFSDRAKKVLKEVDIIVCEEFRVARQFLKYLEIDKPLIAINEHTEKTESYKIIQEIQKGKNVALISDHGTPLLEDPGHLLLQLAIKNNIFISSIPGPSSILSALILSGFNIKKFLYYGLLSRKNHERLKELEILKNFPYTIILIDVPYRLEKLLTDVLRVFGEKREVSLSLNLTTESELILNGNIKEIINYIRSKQIKKNEFVLVVKGNINVKQSNFKVI